MPEGPELHLASRFVNHVCRDRLFAGKVVKSAVSLKNPDVDWDLPAYLISATSRGKEVKLTLIEANSNQSKTNGKKKNVVGKTLDISFRFGMSGQFKFQNVDNMHKHSHLNFYTKDEPKMVLSFVDYRRFGRWEIDGTWNPERGPCVMFEYQDFRKNVLESLSVAAFNKPICETMLNQKFFNGIGNYLRAEILYRLSIPPFTRARDVLEPLVSEGDDDKKKPKIKQELPDILQLCHTVPMEVINLGGKGYDPEGGADDYSAFSEWLQCYYQTGMRNMVDHNKRTIWFKGEAGPMVPKDGKSRGKKKTKLETSEEPPKKKSKATPKAQKTPASKRIKEEPINSKSSRMTRGAVTKMAKTPSEAPSKKTRAAPAKAASAKKTKVTNSSKRKSPAVKKGVKSQGRAAGKVTPKEGAAGIKTPASSRKKTSAAKKSANSKKAASQMSNGNQPTRRSGRNK